MLENRDKQPGFEELKRRASTWVMSNTSGRAPMAMDGFEKNEQQRQHQHHCQRSSDHNDWTTDPWGPSDDYKDGGELFGCKGEGESKGKGGGFKGERWTCGDFGRSSQNCPKGKGFGKDSSKGGEGKSGGRG